MKKYIKNLMILTLGAVLYTACTDEVGTVIGNDGAPYVSIFKYVATQPNDPDTDAAIRVAANNKVSAVYYLTELTADKKERGMSDDAYAEYVATNGTQLELLTDSFSGGKYADFVATNMKGEYTITVVGVDGAKKASASTTFIGLDWVTIADGTYYFSAKAQSRFNLGASATTSLQYLKTDPTRYRFKFLYGVGKSLEARLTEERGVDENGDSITFMRVEPQATGVDFGNYGNINVRDLGYWQEDDSFAFSADYGCYITDDQSYCCMAVQMFVSAGSLGYGWDEFVAD